MKKTMTILGIIILCGLVLCATFAVTQNTCTASENSTINITYAQSDLINNGSIDTERTGTIYYEIKYESKSSILGMEFNSQRSITDAIVSLYKIRENNWSDMVFMNITGNPLCDADSRKDGHTGIYYKFSNVPYGNYVIIAEKDGNQRKTSLKLDETMDGCVIGVVVFYPDLRYGTP